jgi:hypothetical protein
MYERYADGEVLAEDLVKAKLAACGSQREIPNPEDRGDLPEILVLWAIDVSGDMLDLVMRVAEVAELSGANREQEEREQAVLIREVFGNPFRPVTLDIRWQTETVVALATGIYADRAFDRMPILADAMEEAGCDNADMLNHCRGEGPHVRGCWVVDLVLGKS